MARTPLPESWVERIFAILTTRYGVAFIRQYEGMKMSIVKADWALLLGGFMRQGDNGEDTAPAIVYALENLPSDRPPNAAQFRDICRQYREPERQALPAPCRPAPEMVRHLMAELQKPRDDLRPMPVQVADRYIKLWGNSNNLNPFRRGKLEEARATMRAWEEGTYTAPKGEPA